MYRTKKKQRWVKDEKAQELTILYLSDRACAPHEVEGPPAGQSTGTNSPAEAILSIDSATRHTISFLNNMPTTIGYFSYRCLALKSTPELISLTYLATSGWRHIISSVGLQKASPGICLRCRGSTAKLFAVGIHARN